MTLINEACSDTKTASHCRESIWGPLVATECATPGVIWTRTLEIFAVNPISTSSGFLTLLFAKRGYTGMPSTTRTFLWSNLAQIPVGKFVEISQIGHGIKSSAIPQLCRDDAEVKTWHLSPAMYPPPMWVGLKNDWWLPISDILYTY